MSTFDIRASNLVIVGAWNPAIISPEWLRNQFPALFPEKQFVAEVIAGPVPTMRFTMAGMIIDPSGGRLVLSPSSADAGLFKSITELASGIFERLPHTPIIAVGHNFSFKLETGESFRTEQFVAMEGRLRFYRELDLASFLGAHVRHSFAIPNGQLNIDYDSPPEGRTLSLNYHYPARDAAATREAIGRLCSNSENAESLCRRLVTVEAASSS